MYTRRWKHMAMLSSFLILWVVGNPGGDVESYLAAKVLLADVWDFLDSKWVLPNLRLLISKILVPFAEIKSVMSYDVINIRGQKVKKNLNIVEMGQLTPYLKGLGVHNLSLLLPRLYVAHILSN